MLSLMNLASRCLLQCNAVLMIVTSAYAEEYTSLPPPPRQAFQAQQITYHLSLEVNGRIDSQLSKVLYKDGQYWISSQDLIRNYVKVSDQSGLVSVNQIDQVKVKYISTKQILELNIPNEWLPEQYLSNLSTLASIPAQSGTGLVLNYDSYLAVNSKPQSSVLNTWLEQRFFSPSGILLNTGIYRHFFNDHSNHDKGYMRYETYWRNNNSNSTTTYQIGDFISNALSWSNVSRIGGLQISRNFSIRPDLITYPLLDYTGIASTPGMLDLFINGNKVSSNTISSGPFTLTHTPYINGAGEATIVTTDTLGRQVSTTLPFYVANTLLKKGLSDFDVSLGFRRLNYGIKNFDYEDAPSFSGIYRYGLANYLTWSSHVELNRDLSLWGVGADIRLGHWGVLSNSFSQSNTTQTGYQFTSGYSYHGRDINFNIQHTKRSSNFQDLSILDTGQSLSRKALQSSLSFKPFGENFGFIGLGYFDVIAQDQSRTQLANLSYSHRLWKSSSFTFSLNKTLNQPGFNSQLQFTFPLGYDRGSMNASIQRDVEGGYSKQVLYSRPAPTDQGLGWNLGYGDHDQKQASAIWKNQKFTLQSGVSGDAKNTNYWAQINGSIIYLDGLFATNKVNDAFLVVKTNGFPEVPVYYDNRLIGHTDQNGTVLVPSVNAYYPGKLYIDTLDLPPNVEMIETEKRIAVEDHKGAVVHFPIQKVRAANIKLLDQNNQPLPIGTIVEVLETQQKTIVGYDGWVYLTHLNVDNTLNITAPNEEKCQQHLSFKTELANMMLTVQCPVKMPVVAEN